MDTGIKAFMQWRSRGKFEGTAHLWQDNCLGDQEQVAVKGKTCSYSHVCGASVVTIMMRSSSLHRNDLPALNALHA